MSGTVPTGRPCLVCDEGHIIQKTDRVFSDHYRPAIIGPGSASQYSDVTSFHCENCGVIYEFLPPPGVKRKEKK